MSLVVGIDIGTQGTKSIAVDIDESRIIASATWSHDVVIPRSLHAEQDAKVYEQSFFASFEKLLSNPLIDKSKIVAISVSSLYSGSGIPVDETITPLDRCLIWMDRRAEKEVDDLKKTLDLSLLFERTANYINSYYGYTKILWYKNNKPNIYKKAKYFLPINSYINYLLTKNIAIDHSSACNIGGVYNIKEHFWDFDLIEKIGLETKHFHENIVCSKDVVGTIESNLARKLGLSDNVKVMAGGVDAPMALFASGINNTEDHVAMMGTSTCWGFLSKSDKSVVQEFVSMPFVYNDLELLYTFGGTSTSGALVTWFLNNFCAQEKEFAEKEAVSIFKYLEREFLQKTTPGANGLLMLPYFMGERSPIWDAKSTGMILGLGMEHSKADIYRAILESTALSLRDNMELAKEKGCKLSDRLIVVGGTSKSIPWMQIISDVVQLPIFCIEEDVEAALGDAIIAALGAGLIEDPSIAQSWFSLKKLISPHKEHEMLYNKLFELYRSSYKSIKNEMASLKEYLL